MVETATIKCGGGGGGGKLSHATMQAFSSFSNNYIMEKDRKNEERNVWDQSFVKLDMPCTLNIPMVGAGLPSLYKL